MTLELRRVDPMRAANIGAMVYGLFMGAMALVFAPFFLLVGALAPAQGPGPQSAAFVAILLVAYPIAGVVLGWITGLLMSAIYNLVIRWSGGLLLECDNVAAGSIAAGGPAPAAAE